MPGVPIPLAVGAVNRTSSAEPPSVQRNFYVERDVSGGTQEQYQHLQRPGLAVYRTLDATAGLYMRGIGYAQGLFSNKAIGVVGTGVYTFDGSSQTGIMNVANDGGFVELAFTNFGVAILSAGILYFYDTTPHTVAIPGGKTPVSITSINSYVIVGCSDGTWFWLVPGDIAIDALHFATAESMPDNLVAVYQLHDNVFMFGASSTERWSTTGQADLIMEPSPGMRLDYGLLHRDTLQPLDNTLYFVADNGQVMRLGDGEPERVSNAGIEERIRLRTGGVSALTFQYDGHSFYVLYIAGQGSFAFDLLTNTWCEFLSAQQSTGWIGRFATTIGDKTLIGDGFSGTVYTLDSTISKDNGVNFERAVSGIVPFGGGRQRNDSIQVWAGVAGSAPSANLRLRYHDGNSATYGSYQTATIRSPNDIVRYTRLGAAIPPHRIIELSCVDDAVIRISQAEANTGRAW